MGAKVRKENAVWHFLALSFLVPAIGGLAVFIARRKTDRKLADICLVSSIVHPFLLGMLFQSIFELLGVYDPLDMAGLISVWVTGTAISLGLMKTVLKGSRYRHFLLVTWLGAIGTLYLYFGPYKKCTLRNDAIILFASLILITIAFRTLVTPAIEGFYYETGHFIQPSILCPKDLSEEWVQARDTYNDEIDSSSIILLEVQDLYESDYYTIECSSLGVLESAADRFTEWYHTSYKAAKDRLLEASDKMSSCDPNIYHSTPDFVRKNDGDIFSTILTLSEDVGELTRTC